VGSPAWEQTSRVLWEQFQYNLPEGFAATLAELSHEGESAVKRDEIEERRARARDREIQAKLCGMATVACCTCAAVAPPTCADCVFTCPGNCLWPEPLFELCCPGAPVFFDRCNGGLTREQRDRQRAARAAENRSSDITCENVVCDVMFSQTCSCKGAVCAFPNAYVACQEYSCCQAHCCHCCPAVSPLLPCANCHTSATTQGGAQHALRHADLNHVVGKYSVMKAGAAKASIHGAVAGASGAACVGKAALAGAVVGGGAAATGAVVCAACAYKGAKACTQSQPSGVVDEEADYIIAAPTSGAALLDDQQGSFKATKIHAVDEHEVVEEPEVYDNGDEIIIAPVKKKKNFLFMPL